MNTNFVLILSLTLCGICHAEVQHSIGDVYDVKTNKLIYREFHTFSKPPHEEFMKSLYKATDGSPIAERRVGFTDGFADGYSFSQPNLGIEKVVIRSKKGIEYQEKNKNKITNTSFSPNNIDNAVVNAGMFNAVNRKWASLINGETVEIDLVAPERGRTYGMRLSQTSRAKSEMVKYVDAKNTVVFNLTLSNRLLRLLVAPIELGYDLTTKRLVFYHGPSNLYEDNGKKIGNVRVIYSNS